MIILLSIDIYAYMTNFYTFVDYLIQITFIICSIPLIILLIRTCKKSKDLYKKDPLFYIQTYKESNSYENVLKFLKWLFIFSILIIIVPDLTEFKYIHKNEISLKL